LIIITKQFVYCLVSGKLKKLEMQKVAASIAFLIPATGIQGVPINMRCRLIYRLPYPATGIQGVPINMR